MNPDSGRDGVGADRRGAALGGEDRAVLVTSGALCDPSAQRGGGGGIQRGDSVFATLAVDPQVRRFGQVKISMGQSDELADAEASADQRQQDDVVTAAVRVDWSGPSRRASTSGSVR